MPYHIKGLQRDDGTPVELEIEAETEDDAIEKAADAGVVVRSASLTEPTRYGGITRKWFAIILLSTIALSWVVAAIFLDSPDYLLVDACMTLLIIGGSVPLASLRLVNTGMHWVYGFLMLIPVINLWCLIICFARPTGFEATRTYDKAGRVICGTVIVGIVVLVFVKAMTL